MEVHRSTIELRPRFGKMPDGTYIEIKGFLRDYDKFKFEQFPGTLKILSGKDIQYCFDYVYQKYGKDLVSLYD